ncbi:MAG: transcription antitermination factor NusB [Elusimicrobiota bacterium]
MGRRRLAREIALQSLYLLDVSSGLLGENPASRNSLRSSAQKPADEETLLFARLLIEGTQSKIKEIDSAIEKRAVDWRLERMAAVDRNILRIAAYELLFSPDVPPKAAIDEALEITRKFSTAESTRFINGILDKIAREGRASDPKKDRR